MLDFLARKWDDGSNLDEFMKIFLKLKNYRCFVQPAIIEITNGFTAFVGANNAGKSTIMRFLLEFRILFKKIQLNGNFINLIRLDANEEWNPLHVLDRKEIFSNLNDLGIEFNLDFEYESEEKNIYSLNRASFLIDRNLRCDIKLFTDSGEVKVVSNIEFNEDRLMINGVPKVDLEHLFNICSLLANTLYIGPFRNAINIGSNTDYLDIQIGEAFIKQYKQFKSGNNKEQNLAVSQLTADIAKIFEFDRLEISPSDDDKTLHIDVNGKPYKQHELGSGLQQFIIVMANVLVKKPSYVLIDEPELNLHPRLQLDFLTALGAYASNGIWFSTHSVGLARSAAQQVYSVLSVKDGDSVIRQLEGTPRLSEFLGEMSFSSHKEMGFDKVLLVEGPTDVPVFQQFLRKMNKEHKILLLPLHGYIHGGVADQLEEIMRITTNINVIIDSEKTSATDTIESDRQAFIDLCNAKGINNYVLEYRATENYFSNEIVKLIFGDDYEGLSPFVKLKDAKIPWGKSQNYKLARELTITDLKKTDFYKFLEDL